MSWTAILYDWGGWNREIFLLVNEGTPAMFLPVATLFSYVLGNYWTAPAVMIGFWVWSRTTPEVGRSAALRAQLARFVAAFGIAFAVVGFSKLVFDFPRPAAVFGYLWHSIGPIEVHYSLPSGHSTYAALVAGALWPMVRARWRLALVAYVALVGWSRMAAGMHFPADVLAGWLIALGSLAVSRRLLQDLLKLPRLVEPD
ncbi:MAG: phosphoesterase [Cupriavidus sp.]|uniref:phosphatase PAP2 family protein n=1 Tax=Cupriavidus pauculus TaxID=82633 RepID=UPI000C4BA0F1|nr:phosphatase PAP2 family protein [Cupriavidus pauculus]KAB0600417.1 phosphatase PAP2 family protein [Cupriavidus pauculus]MBU68015.1 phosphoesterase [Cupriavidus sp.]MBY4733410.1 phosphatase PAP2 family protein [Cupriavidus pauculus]UAL03849.1 phosphatase PAP2 family protein [Cupriavidus pauculus]